MRARSEVTSKGGWEGKARAGRSVRYIVIGNVLLSLRSSSPTSPLPHLGVDDCEVGQHERDFHCVKDGLNILVHSYVGNESKNVKHEKQLKRLEYMRRGILFNVKKVRPFKIIRHELVGYSTLTTVNTVGL